MRLMTKAACSTFASTLDFVQFRTRGGHLRHGSGLFGFTWLHVLHLAGAVCVTRAKSSLKAHRVYLIPTDRTTGIVCGQSIALDSFYAKQNHLAASVSTQRTICSNVQRGAMQPTDSILDLTGQQ